MALQIQIQSFNQKRKIQVMQKGDDGTKAHAQDNMQVQPPKKIEKKRKGEMTPLYSSTAETSWDNAVIWKGVRPHEGISAHARAVKNQLLKNHTKARAARQNNGAIYTA